MSQIFYKIRDNCKRQINDTVFDMNVKKKYCELIWDGIMCWPKTEAGVDVSLPCPEYFGYSPKTNASKKCTELGQWFVHEELNTTWTNYSQCNHLLDNNTQMIRINVSDDYTLYHTWLPRIKTLKHTGYCLSITTLLLAIIIFSCFKKLQCARNRLHMHLFISFALKALVTLFKDFIFIDGTVLEVVEDGTNKYVKEHNFWICKAITSFWQYCIETNYFLVLMEGIYLHNLLFLSLNSDKDNINLFISFGWGLPFVFIIHWILLKILYDDEYCWTKSENKYFELLIHVPIVITTLINFILFIKIFYIILVKLNTMYIQQRRIKYRRLIRSTLILMPLFGVPYMISISSWYIATTDKTVELIWIFFDQAFTSLQGFFVAFLYCLSNNDVKNELKKQFSTHISGENKRNSFPLYATISNRFSFTTDNNDRQLTS